MANLSVIAELARELMNEHGLGDWVFQWDRAKRRAGLCRHWHRIISLSQYFVLRNDVEMIYDVILHEIAHALVGHKHGHGEVWKAKCREIGAQPNRCCTQADMPKGRFRAVCNGCQKEFHRHKRHRQGNWSYCTTCGPEKGRLTYRG